MDLDTVDTEEECFSYVSMDYVCVHTLPPNPSSKIVSQCGVSTEETTESERLLVVKWPKEGKSLREIASLIGVTHGCVQKILQKYIKTGSVANIPGRGRKEILSTLLQRRGRSSTQKRKSRG
ncbi:uncharacterized protein TNCT_161631 [Trichonephila clavata]|uniref:Paired domain-containing protein n=1 Tax=Trichonephila clavata TaxID=2740835 RepID=A0A8X6K9B1_TRICU|nr:uncharacterized protein TNCT_161631 [Trichonephila clavata]